MNDNNNTKTRITDGGWLTIGMFATIAVGMLVLWMPGILHPRGRTAELVLLPAACESLKQYGLKPEPTAGTGCRLKATTDRTDGGVWIVPGDEDASLFLPSAQIVSLYQP